MAPKVSKNSKVSKKVLQEDKPVQQKKGMSWAEKLSLLPLVTVAVLGGVVMLSADLSADSLAVQIGEVTSGFFKEYDLGLTSLMDELSLNSTTNSTNLSLMNGSTNKSLDVNATVGNNSTQERTVRNPSDLLFAISSAKEDEVRQILRENPDYISFRNEFGETVLHVAAISDSVSLELVKFLVENGAKELLNEAAGEAPYRRTPLHWWLYTAAASRDAVVEYLVEQGADPLVETEEGQNSLQMAETMKLPGLAAKMRELSE